MICCLTALSRATRSSPGSSGPRAVPRERGLATRADVCDLTSLQDGHQLPGPADVVVHLGDKRRHAVESHHPAQPVCELDRDVLAVEIDVLVEHVRLDPALGAVE